MKLNLYCTCGGALQITVPDDEAAQIIRQRLWEPMHRGAGHAPTEARQAGRVRRQSDELLWELRR